MRPARSNALSAPGRAEEGASSRGGARRSVGVATHLPCADRRRRQGGRAVEALTALTTRRYSGRGDAGGVMCGGWAGRAAGFEKQRAGRRWGAAAEAPASAEARRGESEEGRAVGSERSLRSRGARADGASRRARGGPRGSRSAIDSERDRAREPGGERLSVRLIPRSTARRPVHHEPTPRATKVTSQSAAPCPPQRWIRRPYVRRPIAKKDGRLERAIRRARARRGRCARIAAYLFRARMQRP